MDEQAREPSWPPLPYGAWKDTCATLQLWTQVVGKVRLALTPWLNHGWHVPLYVTASGLTTSPIPRRDRTFTIDFDFVDHRCAIRVSDGASEQFALRPQSVADFYAELMATLKRVGITVAVKELPCEIAGAIPFSQDRVHSSYDPEYANRFWRALVQVDRVFKHFRTGFVGKASPVHFFWGSFDLAVTRFSGRRAPLFQGVVPGVAANVMQDAYSHEVSSAGFWPGGNGVDASFYSYAYPAPAGFVDATVRPAAASFNSTLGEFVLPYEAVRTSADPDATLMEFLQSTYEAAATLAGWDRGALERPAGLPGVCPPTARTAREERMSI